MSMEIAQAQTNLDETQKLIQRWVALEQQNTALLTTWREQQQLLKQRQQMLAEEKQQLEGILANNANDSDDVEAHRISLLALQNTMEQDQSNLQNSLQTALGALRSLQVQLPPPLQISWQEKLQQLSSSSLTEEDQESKSDNASQTLQVVLELLTELDDFKKRISINEAPITLKDDQAVLVKQLYLGLSHAWYVSVDGRLTGYGQSTIDGWRWISEQVVDGSTVQAAIAMIERNSDVALVSLPLALLSPPVSGMESIALSANDDESILSSSNQH